MTSCQSLKRNPFVLPQATETRTNINGLSIEHNQECNFNPITSFPGPFPKVGLVHTVCTCALIPDTLWQIHTLLCTHTSLVYTDWITSQQLMSSVCMKHFPVQTTCLSKGIESTLRERERQSGLAPNWIWGVKCYTLIYANPMHLARYVLLLLQSMILGLVESSCYRPLTLTSNLEQMYCWRLLRLSMHGKILVAKNGIKVPRLQATTNWPAQFQQEHLPVIERFSYKKGSLMQRTIESELLDATCSVTAQPAISDSFFMTWECDCLKLSIQYQNLILLIS